MDAPCEQRVVAEIQPGHDVRRAERDLLSLGEKVVRVAVENELSNRSQRDELFGDQLRRIEHVEAEALGVALAEDLNAELPLRIGTGLDRLPEIAAMKVWIGTRDLHGFVPGE